MLGKVLGDFGDDPVPHVGMERLSQSDTGEHAYDDVQSRAPV